MGISRKEWLAVKHEMELNGKIRHSAKKMKTSFAVLSASILLSNLVEPVRQVMAEEKATENQKEAKYYSENSFLHSLIPSASSIAEKNDLYTSVMLAQAILESGWGSSQLASSPNHNLFGIKGNYEGNSVNMDTLEDSGNQNYYQIEADFRKYPSYHESLEDYASLLRNGTGWDPLFYEGTWKSNAPSYQDATASLTGKYATDSAYHTKLNNIIEANTLTEYDTPSSYIPPVLVEETTNEETVLASDSTYTVRSGDTLYGIALQHGILLQDLMEWNNLKDSLLHPGEVLLVARDSEKTPTGETEDPETIVDQKTEGADQPDSSIYSTYYVVKSGDSLWKIGQSEQVTVSQLKEWNNLKSDLIQPGQSLRLMKQTVKEESTEAAPQNTPSISKPVQGPPVQSGVKIVTVVSGDSLYKIANRSNVSVSQLKEWNQLKSDLIYPGQRLSILETEVDPPVLPQKGEDISEKVQAPEEVSTTNEDPIAAFYIVKSGDTLYRIATQTGNSVNQLKEWNQLDSDIILIGQNLKVRSEKIVIEVEKSTNVKPEEFYHTHEVQKGDTLYAISNQYGVSVTQLIEWNNVTSNLIYVGQSIRIK